MIYVDYTHVINISNGRRQLQNLSLGRVAAARGLTYGGIIRGRNLGSRRGFPIFDNCQHRRNRCCVGDYIEREQNKKTNGMARVGSGGSSHEQGRTHDDHVDLE